MSKGRALAYVENGYIPYGGGVILGLLLPYGKQGATHMPPISEDAAIWYADIERPLLINHDIRRRVGTVRKIWRTEEGVAFMADLDVPSDEVPKGVSAGLVYYYEDGPLPLVTDVYVYEVSLTESPAFLDAQITATLAVDEGDLHSLKSRIFASDMKPEEKNQADMAQELVGLLRMAVGQQRQGSAKLQAEIGDLEALMERVNLLEERLSKAESAIADVQAAVEQLMAQAQQAQAQAQEALSSAATLMRNAEAQLSAAVQELDSSFAATLKQLLTTTKKLSQTQQV